MRAYVVSYLGEDETLVQKRLAIHNKQLDWFLEHSPPELEISVFDQNYKPEFRRNDSRIQYWKYTGVVLKQWAVRNKFLEDLYSSQENYAIFADNDACLYDHFDGKSALKFIQEKNSELVSNGIHCFVPIDAAKSPFNDYVNDRKHEYDSNFIFNPVIWLRTAFFALCNIKKVLGKEIYFRDFSAHGKLGHADDFIFGYDLTKNGVNIFKTYNFILKDMVGEKYSLLAADNEERNEIISSALKLMMDEEGFPYLQDNVQGSRKEFVSHLRKKYLKSAVRYIPKFKNDDFF
jgi:hypothetical protein